MLWQQETADFLIKLNWKLAYVKISLQNARFCIVTIIMYVAINNAANVICWKNSTNNMQRADKK